MIKVSNGKCIRRLSRKTMLAAKTRNLIAVVAIALTTVLFTSLFTIAMSINDGFQQSNFRQCGGFSHGTFKYLTEAQFDELKDDTQIREWGLRRFLGMPTGTPFQKSHVEVGYSDANQAHWMYCDPVEGRLPREDTNEAATDLRVLELLGVEPELGTEFSLTFDVCGQETTQSFTLCGWWNYDEAIIANHVLIPESRVDQVLGEMNIDPESSADGMTGSWNLDIMLKSSLHIEDEMNEILARHGYQSLSRSEDGNYISTGVNWGYTGAQLSDNLDPGTVLAVAAMLILIIFTGYLIIYNIFQISVAGDIRFYGLLKTIGTTPRQLRRIIRQQALMLSLLGIPLGLLAGWLIGAKLTPAVIRNLDGIVSVVSVNPVIFLGAAVFSLLTVLLSCARPGRMAARVSPIEAVRYTEGGSSRKKGKKSGKGVSLPSMAWANLGRSRSKTTVTVLSLSLAVVLLTMTVTFTGGFDMDKYLSSRVYTDFVLADAGYFQTSSFFNASTSLPRDVIEAVQAQGGITESGCIYGKTSAVQEFVTEDYYRARYSKWSDSENLERLVAMEERNSDGLLADTAQLYGMEAFALDQLTVLEGDLSPLYEPGSHAIAAVYADDDYGNPEMGSHWARLGDTVALRYVEEFEYFNPDTGEVYGSEPPEDELWQVRASKYRDEEYQVTALVVVPYALSYRYFGSDEFVLNGQTFVQDSGTRDVMLYAFDVAEGTDAEMESFLAAYTQEIYPQLDYESKATYQAEFESFRSMFLLLGGALSFIVGLVGILNFFNAILTGILTRRREFAVLQSIGMTGRQLKGMLICEGLLYAVGSVVFAFGFSLVLSPLLRVALEQMFWFFSYRFTLMPVLIVAPVFAAMGIMVPLGVYRVAARSTIVERLREAEP